LFFGFFLRVRHFEWKSLIFDQKIGTSWGGNFALDYQFPKEYFLVIRFHVFRFIQQAKPYPSAGCDGEEFPEDAKYERHLRKKPQAVMAA